MINPQELRIGNLLQVDVPAKSHALHFAHGAIVPVTEVCNPKYEVIEVLTPKGVCQSWPIQSLSPIPLTEEWLKRVGFCKSSTGFMQLSFTKSVECFEWYRSDMCGVIFTEEGLSGFVWFGGDHVQAALDYVHQLQNLFYCLTGQELDIETKKEAGE